MGYGSCKEKNTHWGVETVKLRAAAARSPGDVVRMGTGHSDGCPVDITLADDTNIYRVAVAQETIASGSVGLYAWKGTVPITVPSGNYTAGNGVKVLDAALADSGAAATAFDALPTNISFGCIVTGGTSVTEITVTLHGDQFTATT